MNEEKTESPIYSPSMSPNRKAFFRKKNPNQKRSNNSEYILILLEKEPMQRTKTEIRILSEYLSERFEFFKKFKNEPTKLEKLVSVLHLETFKPNEKIIKFGEEGDKFYILLQGKVNIYKLLSVFTVTLINSLSLLMVLIILEILFSSIICSFLPFT